VLQRVQENLEQQRVLEKQLRSLKDKFASGQGTDLAAGAVDINGVKVVATRLDGADVPALRNAVDQLKERLKSAVVVLATVGDAGKVTLVAGVTADLTTRVKAGDIVGAIATMVGGKGGGRADFAQAGGTDTSALPAALDSVAGLVRSRLA
jgi:alanyl-tRNA synthetase